MINKLKAQSSKLKVTTQNLKFYVLSFGFALCALHFTLNTAFAQAVSSTELINHAKDYDGKVVVYSGEVIGDIMVRGKYAWINVFDGKTAIGIWLDKDLAKEIIYTGTYKSKGDAVEISGIFHRACLEHGGDLDIHAQSLSKTFGGASLSEPFNNGKRNTALLLSGALCLVLIWSRLKLR